MAHKPKAKRDKDPEPDCEATPSPIRESGEHDRRRTTPEGVHVVPAFSEVGEGGEWAVETAAGEYIPLGRVSGIYSSKDSYLVYDCQPEDADWLSLSYAHARVIETDSEFNDVWNATGAIYSQAKKLLQPRDVGPLISHLATALANSLEGDKKGASAAIVTAERWLSDVNERRLTPAFVREAITCGFLVFLLGLVLRGAPTDAALPALDMFGTVLQWAPLGTLLSILAFRKGDSLPFDSLGTVEQCRDIAMRRVLVGVLSGIGALLLIDSGMLFSFAEGGEDAAMTPALAAFAAGFSERWGSQVVERIPGFASPVS